MVDWQPEQIILNEYLIEKELGRGGMGRVWLVKSQLTGRQFAVKQALLKEEKHRKAFLTELQTWIDLPEHPNIVPCRFFRTVGDEVVIFADYIEGGTLADWIAKGKLTSIEKIIDVAIQFAWGLHAIHERGLIHQDVKPGNVLMTPDGVPMVTDFGLARARQKAADGSFVSPALPPGPQRVRHMELGVGIGTQVTFRLLVLFRKLLLIRSFVAHIGGHDQLTAGIDTDLSVIRRNASAAVDRVHMPCIGLNQVDTVLLAVLRLQFSALTLLLFLPFFQRVLQLLQTRNLPLKTGQIGGLLFLFVHQLAALQILRDALAHRLEFLFQTLGRSTLPRTASGLQLAAVDPDQAKIRDALIHGHSNDLHKVAR